jgi:hypothetical protein
MSGKGYDAHAKRTKPLLVATSNRPPGKSTKKTPVKVNIKARIYVCTAKTLILRNANSGRNFQSPSIYVKYNIANYIPYFPPIKQLRPFLPRLAIKLSHFCLSNRSTAESHATLLIQMK